MLDKLTLFFYSLLFSVTPLVMAPFTSELFEFNKLIFIYTATTGVVFFWVLKMILYKKIIIKKTPFDIPILFFFTAQTLSTLFSIDVQTSFFGYYGRFNGGLLSTVSYIVLFYGFVSNVTAGMATLIRLLKISLFSSFVVILWGMPGKVGYDLSCLLFLGQFNNNCWTDQFRPAERMFSTLGQPNWLGAYLAINFFIGIYFFFKNILNQRSPDSIGIQHDKKAVLYGIYLFVNFSSILFTRSRSALLSIILGLIAFAILGLLKYKDNLTQQYKKIVILLLGLVISIILFKTGIQKIDKFLSISSFYKANNSTASVERRLAQPSGITTSSDIRKIVWKGAVDLGFRYPLFGTGVETFAYSYYFVRPTEHNLTSEWDYLYNKAHNEYLNYFATTGFVGLISYLVFIVSVLVYGWKNIKYKILNIKNTNQKSKIERQNNNEAMKQWNNQSLIFCLLLSYLTILITNFFGFSTTTINLFFYLIPAFIVVLSSKNSAADSGEHFNILKLSRRQKIMILALLLTTIYLLLGLSRYYLADIKYAQGDNLSKVGKYQEAARLLTDAYNLRYEHVYEDKLSYILANIAFIASYNKDNKLAKNLMQTSDGFNRKSLKSSPKNVLYWKTRAKNYYLFYQITLDSKDLESAIKALEEAEKLSPTDPKIPYSLAIFNSLLEKDEAAIRNVNISIQYKPDYRDAYFLKGQFLKKAGNRDDALSTFNYILKHINPNDSEVKQELETL